MSRRWAGQEGKDSTKSLHQHNNRGEKTCAVFHCTNIRIVSSGGGEASVGEMLLKGEGDDRHKTEAPRQSYSHLLSKVIYFRP